ncbi:MAG: acetate--CoA ligase family protein, partial [Clostridiales bacterium]
MGFQELFYPRAVAVFGSVAPGKLAGILIDQIRSAGFHHLYAVNPKGLAAGEIPGYQNITQIEDDIDLAVIAAPAGAVAQILEDCGQKGVKAAVIISSGFGEAGNKAGEAEIKAIAAKHGICFIGPNCAGLINTAHNFAPTLQAYPPAGATAVISQSGAVGGAIMEWAQLHGLGVSKFASYGNGADLNQVEFLRYLKDDPETKVVALYIENINNGEEFMAALKELTAVKPVIAIKAGRTGTGQRAALSHTGSMAGADAVYDAAFKASGAIRVDSLDELIDLCKGFAYLPPVHGRKVALVTNSGGPGVMTADVGETLGLNIGEPSAAAEAELRSFLPAWAGFHNPVDMTVEGTGENYRRTIETMLKEFDAALPIFFGPPYLDTTPIAQGMLDAFHNSGKPVFCAMETGLKAADSVRFLRDNQLPNFPSPERAIKVIAHMAAYEEYKHKRAAAEIAKAAPKGNMFSNGPVLIEPYAMKLLSENGIATPPYRYITTRAEVGQACQELGWPLVIKVVSPQIIHKSDCGGVKFNINSPEQACAAFDQLEQIAAGKDFRGVIAYPMLRGSREVLLGLTRDRQFGPVVAFGMGGVYTEVMKDIQLAIAPVTKATALEMIHSIKSYPILKGVRVEKP